MSPNLASITNRPDRWRAVSSTESDDHHACPVAVIGKDLKKRFFQHTDPVGKIIHVQGARSK